MKQLQPTEYMYASARIRAKENRLVGKERIDLLVDAKTSADVMSKLAEYGIAPTEAGEGGEVFLGDALGRKREEMLQAFLRNALTMFPRRFPSPLCFIGFAIPTIAIISRR